MSFTILNSYRKKREQRIGKYMQMVRDIAKTGLSRRDLLRMGLVAGAGGLAAVHGCGGGGGGSVATTGSASSTSPLPGSGGDPSTGLDPSPPNTPFSQPFYHAPVVTPVTLDPLPALEPNTAPTASSGPGPSGVADTSGYREANRPDHQRYFEFQAGLKMYEMIEQEVVHNFYPEADGVPPSRIWTHVEKATGAIGPLRIKARYGEPVLNRLHNALPADNGGFGIPQTSNHLHNGHTASESDGGPTHFYDSGQFKDYHYPNVRAGFASDVPESTLNGRTVPGDVRETMSFLWFHAHRFDFTAQNVYKGLAGFYTLYSDDIDLDTDDETTGLRLPSGEFDIPMIFADKVFDPTTGQLFFDLFNIDGILGDKVAVNGKIQPFLEVKRRKYRFRLLDGGPSRIYEFFLSNGAPFIQITNDGNLLPRPLTRQSVRIGVAERVDVIVDFSGANIGDKIYLQNRLEMKDGRGTTGNIIAPSDLVEFRVVGDAQDDSIIPATLLDLPDRNTPIAQTREFQFGRSNGAWVVNGNFFDPGVISASVKQNTAELWTLKSGGGWTHPVHIHFEEFQLLHRDGEPPPLDEIARKDVVRIGDSAVGTDNTGETQFFMRFRDFLGDYPLHCHNTVHEDHAMMIRWEIVP